MDIAKVPLRGVNLGGWLVLERWITPSLFAGLHASDEYSFCTELGEDAAKILQQHRKTFITPQDFLWLKQHNIHAIRIPVGYWVFGNEYPYIGAIDHLDFAVKTAAAYNIQVIIDLHGAPGSQNGWDHSGASGQIKWQSGPNIKKTLQAVERIAERYASAPNLWGIEVLNEPHWDIPHKKLVTYYEAAYHIIRRHCPDSVAVIISDSFRPYSWATIMNPPDYVNVVVDSHLYQCFSPEDTALSMDDHIKKVQTEWRDHITHIQQTKPLIIGEWSVALDTSTFAGFSKQTQQKAQQEYRNAQLQTFAQAAGWFFWTYKTEGSPEWDFRLNT